MNDFLMVMTKPLLACLILTGIHAYLGIHVMERKVIFVDLALAQIAALGATLAIVFHFDLHGSATYWFSLGAAFAGAVIFSLTRQRREKIPHEAVIGIVYAVAAAFSILILSRAAEGDEHIRHMLVGDILLVSMPEVVKMAVLYSLIGVIHWVFRKKFLMISREPEVAYQKGLNVKGWDLMFYITFGVVVTSSVQIAGVLLVFSFLIVPAAAGILLCRDLRSRLFAGWAVGVSASAAGICLSYFFNLPTGAAVICAFGVILLAIGTAQSHR